MHLAWSGPRPNSHDMTCVPSPFCTQDSADAQIEAAVLRLVELLGRQTARELAADAAKNMEMPDAPPTHQND
jgi:hypothetical protein